MAEPARLTTSWLKGLTVIMLATPKTVKHPPRPNGPWRGSILKMVKVRPRAG